MNLQALGLSRRAGPTQLPGLVVVGGRGGVGATTVALSLAGALLRAGRRALVVDRADGPGDAALRLGLDPAALRAAGDAPYASAGGLHVLRVSPRLGARALAERLADLEPAGLEVVVDAGPASDPIAVELLAGATLGVVVATHDPAAVAGAYAALKGALRVCGGGRPCLVVNRAPTSAEGERVAAGLGEVARRFLGRELETLGVVPEELGLAAAARIELRGDAPSRRSGPLEGLALRALSRLSSQRARRAQEHIT